MKLKPLASNMTELELEDYGKTKVLFSYQTPVAALNLSPTWYEKYGCAMIRTNKKWSVTTSKHINKWLDGAKAVEVPQETLDNLV